MPVPRMPEALPTRTREPAAVRGVWPPDLNRRRNALRARQAAALDLAAGHIFDHTGQKGHLGNGSHAQDRRCLQRRVAHEAQDHAGDDGARGRKAAGGLIQVDDVYLGGVREGGRGRGAEGKTPFVAALETTEEWLPHKIKLQAAAGFRLAAIESWAPAERRAGNRSLQRRAVPLRRGREGRVRSFSRDSGRRQGFGAREGIRLAQHRHRKRQDGASQHAPLHEGKIRPALPGRIRIQVQPPLRPAEHGSAPRLGGRSHAADFGEAAPEGNCLAAGRLAAPIPGRVRRAADADSPASQQINSNSAKTGTGTRSGTRARRISSRKIFLRQRSATRTADPGAAREKSTYAGW